MTIIINSYNCIILIPSPVFLPCKAVTVKASVCFCRKLLVKINKIRIFPCDTTYISGNIINLWYPIILYYIRNLIRNNLPSKLTIQWYRIRI